MTGDLLCRPSSGWLGGVKRSTGLALPFVLGWAACGGEAAPPQTAAEPLSPILVLETPELDLAVGATPSGAIVVQDEPRAVGRALSALTAEETPAGQLLDADAPGLRVSYARGGLSARSGAAGSLSGSTRPSRSLGASSGAARGLGGSSLGSGVALSCDPGILCDFVAGACRRSSACSPGALAECRASVAEIRVPARLERLFCLVLDLIECALRAGSFEAGTTQVCRAEAERFFAEAVRLGYAVDVD
jgi:hypothetical protein